MRLNWDRTAFGRAIADPRYSSLLEEHLGGLRSQSDVDYLWGELCEDNKKKVMAELRSRHAAFGRMTVEAESDDDDTDDLADE